MLSGNIGSVTLRRLGDTGNTAQRLQSAAGADQILIAHDDYLKIKESFECKELGNIQVKNKSGELRVYEVVH